MRGLPRRPFPTFVQLVPTVLALVTAVIVGCGVEQVPEAPEADGGDTEVNAAAEGDHPTATWTLDLW